ncbi:MAG: CHAT domain-containing protein [Symploca sp. SIO2E9]|nr:CHAT domain-containing protein [Symploca sp. SIO2E9]
MKLSLEVLGKGLIFLLLQLIATVPVLAQQITPAKDSTGTSVTVIGNQLNISGGTLSGDGSNLFHSLEDFGLDAGQIANFISNPDIYNIFSRVVGGNPSLIDGLIQVSGGNSNLFLINPAGIVFGTNAQLNLPASFTATTATGIGFDDDNWFNVFGNNHYQDLIGSPQSLVFDLVEPGSIINAGNLAVSQGQNLALVGGSVINTGQLRAAGGKIAIAAVPGENLVRLTQPGQLLSLEIEPRVVDGQMLPITALDLPTLLTGSAESLVTRLSFSPQTGVQLNNSGVQVPTEAQTAIVSGTIDTSNFSTDLIAQLPQTGGIVHVIGERVGLFDAQINAAGIDGGGTVLIGSPDLESGPHALRTYISSDSLINVDAWLSGDGGRVIVKAEETTEFYGNIWARGGVFSQNPFLSSEPLTGIDGGGNGGFVELASDKNLIFRGIVLPSAVNGRAGTLKLFSPEITIADGSQTDALEVIADNSILSGDTEGMFTISESTLEELPANTKILLEATGNIAIADLDDQLLNFASGSDGVIELRADSDGDGFGSFSMNPNDSISANQRDVNISGASITVGSLDTSANFTSAEAGAITLNASNGSIRASNLQANSFAVVGNIGNGGTINLNAEQSITVTGLISADSVTNFGDAGKGGDVNLNAENGKISVAQINTSSSNQAAGNISFSGKVVLTQPDTALTTTGGTVDGNITFNDTLNATTASPVSLTLNSGSGTITFNGIGNSVPLDNLLINGTGNVQLAGEHNFIQDYSFDNPVTLIGDATINSPNRLIFNNSVEIQTHQLTLTADEIDLSGTISGQGNLTLEPFTPERAITIGGNDNDYPDTLNLTGAEIDLLNNGINSITIGRVDGSGAITVVGDTTFYDPVSLRTPLGSGSINTVGATLTGDSNSTITLLANLDINTGEILYPTKEINLTSNSGNIDTSAGIIDTSSSTNGGNINLRAGSNIITGDIFSGSRGSGTGGKITFNADSGKIDTTNGTLNSGSYRGDGGDIELAAGNELTTNNIDSSSVFGNGGDIAIKTNNSAISTGNLNSSGGINGGDIRVADSSQFSSGAINSSGSSQKGGEIELGDSGDIEFSWLNSEGGTTGGTINITSQNFVRGTETFITTNGVNASISSAGGSSGGAINIEYGSNSSEPFMVGNASTNGTEGAITSGEFIIAPFESLISTREGNISITTLRQGQLADSSTEIFPSSVEVSPARFPSSVEMSPELSVETSPSSVEMSPELSVETSPSSMEVSPEPSSQSPINPIDITHKHYSPALPSSTQNENLEVIESTDESFSRDFQEYLGLSEAAGTSLKEARKILRRVESFTNIKPAIVYALFVSETITPTPSPSPRNISPGNLQPEEEWLGASQISLLRSLTPQASDWRGSASARGDRLELILVTPQGKPIRKSLKINRAEVISMAKQFRETVTNIRDSQGYLAPAQKMYQWLVAPLEAQLQELGIESLAYIMDAGLRSIPLGAMHDGKQFILEKYSVGLMPSLNLTATGYSDIRNSQLLAMGASRFTNNLSLPAVPVELANITKIWPGKSFLNQDFTLKNLKSQRQQIPFGIIHLATHAEFQAGVPTDSYIQLADGKLHPAQLKSVEWNEPPVELLVLSACRTAVGDPQAELGFAGMAVQAGVKSVLASLWYVSDEGTLGLMSEFYQQLQQAPTKTEALRQTQLAMLKGKVRIEAEELITSERKFPLAANLSQFENRDFSHPYYWSAFVIVGNPW